MSASSSVLLRSKRMSKCNKGLYNRKKEKKIQFSKLKFNITEKISITALVFQKLKKIYNEKKEFCIIRENKFTAVSIYTVWVDLKCCDYREDNKKGTNY